MTQSYNILVDDIIESDLDSDLNREITTKHQIPTGLTPSIVSRLLAGKLDIDSIVSELQSKGKLSTDKALIATIDIVGMRLLPLDEYLAGKPRQFLISNHADLASYQEIIKQHQQIWADAERQRAEENRPEPEHKVPDIQFVESDPEQEKRTAPELFKKNVVSFLDNPSEDLLSILFDYNNVLLTLLDSQPGFSRQLEQALYENQEILTTGRLTINGKAVEPTVSNWLKDFISHHGALFFDNVVLSQYVTDSPNARKLSDSDRKLLIKLLTMYRTIKFFPATLNQLPPEQWQIIPFDFPEQEEKGRVSASPEPVEGKSVEGSHVEESSTPNITPAQWKTLTPIEKRTLAEEYQLTEEMIRQLES